jgi:CRISPR-associated protein Cmr2
MPNPQTPKSYLAVTIGPIVKTLLLARKTRELWAASFLLSKLMEHLIYHLDPDRKHLLIPNVHSAIAGKPLYGAGIYSDKLYMEADHLSDEQIQAGIDMSFEALAKDLLLKQEAQDPNETAAAVSFWKQFLRVRYVKTALADISEGKLSTELTPFLDNFELEDTLIFEEPARDYLLHLFEVKRIFNCPIAEALTNKGAYQAILGKWALFPSTHEIAAFELLNDESGDFLELSQALEGREDDSEEFYLQIEADESKSKLLKPRHKYFCIVHADGDNISEAIKQLGKEQDYLDFSATLAAYGVEAATLINDFGGKPVYIGGDDLLFLTPVHTSEGSVFDLIEKLDKAFPKDKLHPNASMSFALNIVYYKFPLLRPSMMLTSC